jgi:hypothetical protein
LRKVMLLAAMLAMVLVTAAPALGQTATAETEVGDATVTQYAAVCQNVFGEINAVGVQFAGSFNELEAEAEGGAGADDELRGPRVHEQ